MTEPAAPRATADRPLRVLIAGGGLSGLCLAHGLLRDGHDVQVFEREADADAVRDHDRSRRSGYMLSINGDGGEALRRCLPDDLFELFLETSSRTSDRRGTVVFDEHLTELSSMPHLGAPNDGPRPFTAVHRAVLRQILRARLGERLHVGAAAAGYEETLERVELRLADGTSATGDLLVGADGIRSAIRAQRRPDVDVIEAGIAGIGVYGRSPLPPDVVADVPPALIDDVGIAADRRGHRLLLGPWRPRRRPELAAEQLAPDVHLDPADDYVMVSCTVDGVAVPANRDWTDATPGLLRDGMLRAVEGWHPAIRGLIERIELDSLFMIPFGRLEPPQEDAPSRVTLIGDAAHAMLPTLGMGANLGLQDAGRLADALRSAAAGRAGLLDAVAAAERGMREAVTPYMLMTVEHDRHFGGGALQELADA